MAKNILKFNSDWSDDDQAELSEAIGLSETQEDRLFAKHKAVELSDEQAEEYARFVAAQTETEAGDDTGDTSEPEAKPDIGDTNDDAGIDMTDVSIVNERDRDAVTMGEKLSKETNKVFVLGYEARERVNITPLLLRAAILKDEGTEAVALWPMPGSVSRKVDGKVGVYTSVAKDAAEITFGENEKPVWDKYKYSDVNPETGNTVQKTGSFYQKLVRSTVEGKRLLRDYEAQTTGINSYKKDGPECPAGLKQYTRPQIVRRRKLTASRLSYMEAAMRSAIKLDKQCRAIDNLLLVGYRFEQETVDNQLQYVNRNEPVQVFSVTRKKNDKGETVVSEGEPSNMSIGAFVRFDVPAAIVKAGGRDKVTLAHLQDTVKRDTEGKRGRKADGSSQDDWSKHEIGNARQFENILSSLGSYLNPEDKDAANKLQTAIVKRMTEKDGDEFVVILGNVTLALDEAYKVVQARYDAIMSERAKIRDAEKKAA